MIEIGGSSKSAQPRETRASSSAPDTSLGVTRVAIAMAIVIGAIFVLRWVGRRFFGIASVGDGGVVKVLSRSTIGPRQQVLLMQVGKRMLVVANSGVGMNTLCEVTDEQEVASLVSEAQRPVIDRAKSFRSLFT